jgi:hypothetical protein
MAQSAERKAALVRGNRGAGFAHLYGVNRRKTGGHAAQALLVSLAGRAAAAIVIAVAAAGCSSGASSGITTTVTTRTTGTAATEVIIYEPFTRSGTVAAGIDVVARSSNADCYSGAISSPRRDAFRCITKQNLLYDPCFLDLAGPLRLACWRGPHPSQVVIVTPERPFPQLPNHGSADVKGGFPWLIELSNGQYCADDTGASLYFPSIGRANWDCPHGLGWGTIHRDGRHWTMAYSSLASAIGHKAPRLTEIPIKTAWF